MAPNIANGALTEQQEYVVKRVGPSGYAKSAQQIEAAEEQPRDRAENEGVDLQAIAIGADIVECREDERSKHGRDDARDQRPHAKELVRGPCEQSDEHHAEEQLFVDAAPSESINIVQRLSVWALKSSAMGGGGAPSSAAVRVPTTTPNTSDRQTDSSSMAPSTERVSLPGCERTSRAINQVPTPIRHNRNNRGPQAPASRRNTDCRITSAPLRTLMPPGPTGARAARIW